MNNLIETLNSAGNGFVQFAIAMLIQASILIIALLIFELFFRKKVRAVFRYWLWMLVLVKLILPPTLSSPASIGQFWPEKLTPPAIGSQIITTAPSTNISPAIPADSTYSDTSIKPQAETIPASHAVRTVTVAQAIPATPVTWQAIVFVVWIIVLLVMIGLLIQRIFFVRGLIRQSKPAEGLILETLEFCRKRMGFTKPVRLKISPNATSPAVCGLFRPVILVPHDLAPTLGSTHLRPVMMHELAHIKRGDLWINLIQTLLLIAYFYNPLLWLANAVIRRIREQAVDEAVQVAMGKKAEQYPQTLINVAKLAFERPALALRFIGVVESKSQLEGRIKKMLTQPIPKTAKLGLAGLLTIIITAALLLPMATAEKNHLAAESNGQKTELQVIEDKELNLSIAIPADWSCHKNPAPGRYRFSWQLLPSKLKAWAMFIGSEFPQDELAANTPVRQIAVGDAAILKSYFNKYTVRADSWTEYSISEMPAVNYVADYVDEGTAMVEYRSYILSKSMVYWFVFRIEKDKFDSNKERFDSIANSFKLSGGHKTDVQIEVEKAASLKAAMGLAGVHYRILTKAYEEQDWPTVDEAANELSDTIRDYLTEHKELETSDSETYKLLHTLSEISDDLHDSIRDGKDYLIEPLYNTLADKFAEFINQEKTAENTEQNNEIDIAVDDFKIEAVENSALLRVVVSIKNNTNETIPQFKLRFYKGDHLLNLNESGKPQSGWHNAGPLEPGQKWNETTRPIGPGDGKHKFTVILDYDNEFEESDETNNAARISFTKNGSIITNTMVAFSLTPKNIIQRYTTLLKREIDVDIRTGPNNSRLTIQYVVDEICKQAGIPYNFKKSVQLSALECQKYIGRVKFKKISTKDAILKIIQPYISLRFDVDDEGLYLYSVSRRPKDTATPEKLTTSTGRSITLKNDNGRAKGKWSLNGSGHGVLFKAPGDGYTVTSVRIYGSRYGEYAPPKDDFTIYICDKDFNIINNFDFPYSLFKKQGRQKWATLKIEPTEVPKEFAVCVAFDPHKTMGIYLHHDGSDSGNNFKGIPPGMEKFNEGDWLIRPTLKAPDPTETTTTVTNIKSVFEQIDGQAIKFIAEQYGQTVSEAGEKNLYANSHVYYVDPNFILYRGGVGYYYNWTGQTITGKTKLTGTSYPNQTLYDTTGQKLDVKIVPDEQRSNFYHIFWIPKEPLSPGESLYFGWSVDDSKTLPSKTGRAAALTMQNEFGSPAIETFFLVLPKELEISQSNPATGSQELLNFNVYWWTRLMQHGENHVEQIQLKKAKTMGIDGVKKSELDENQDTLQNRIDLAQPGSTVTIEPGIYTKPVRIDKSIKLVGKSLENCVFKVSANEPAIFVDTQGKVLIENVTVKWQLATSDKNIEYPFALGVKDSKVEVKNCGFLPLGNFKRSPVAIKAIGFSNVNINSCQFEGFYMPVFYYEGTEGMVHDSIISNCQSQGITLFSGATVDIVGNIITGSKKHAVRNTGGTLHMKDNLIINNANRGVYLGNKSASGIIANNIIMGNGTGISGFARSKVKIHNNVIADSSYAAISFRKSCRLHIADNIFTRNERGWIMHDSDGKNGNGCQRNTFWKNKTDAENFKKTGNSILSDPLFTDAENGNFSLNPCQAKENNQGLTNPDVFIPLWQKYRQITDS